ncbi:MAG: polyprenyl synthetase family protein [Veillonellaceae bacterium]|nr:polyprenyl synthetase family protein [Veillonellaceae bacterium]
MCNARNGMTADLTAYIAAGRERVEAALADFLEADSPALEPLREAMNYSLLGGGKRLRPVLFLTTLDVLGSPSEPYLPIACAIEAVHTYSLIHDDLPCMDDDDYRRGRLTSHKKYTPGIATLAGDALLTYAFEALTRVPTLRGEIVAELVRILAAAAGPNGMVGGQYIDITSTGRGLSLPELAEMERRKTGCLLTAPLLMAGAVAEADAATRAGLAAFGMQLGLLFQIVDDILDCTGDLATLGKAGGRDAELNKSTYVTLLGLEEARALAQTEADNALRTLREIGLADSILAAFPDYFMRRQM